MKSVHLILVSAPLMWAIALLPIEVHESAEQDQAPVRSEAARASTPAPPSPEPVPRPQTEIRAASASEDAPRPVVYPSQLASDREATVEARIAEDADGSGGESG